MARTSLRRYDTQARVAFILSCLATLGMIAIMILLIRNYVGDLRVIAYGRKSMYGPMIYVATMLTLLLAGAGAAMGAVSAGQRRNELSKRSWAAFFLGGVAISGTIILFAWFFLAGMKTA